MPRTATGTPLAAVPPLPSVPNTVFAPQQLVPSEEGQSIVIRGRLRTLVNGFETANDLKAYRVEFSYAGARMHLKSFKEIPNAGN